MKTITSLLKSFCVDELDVWFSNYLETWTLWLSHEWFRGLIYIKWVWINNWWYRANQVNRHQPSHGFRHPVSILRIVFSLVFQLRWCSLFRWQCRVEKKGQVAGRRRRRRRRGWRDNRQRPQPGDRERFSRALWLDGLLVFLASNASIVVVVLVQDVARGFRPLLSRRPR